MSDCCETTASGARPAVLKRERPQIFMTCPSEDDLNKVLAHLDAAQNDEDEHDVVGLIGAGEKALDRLQSQVTFGEGVMRDR